MGKHLFDKNAFGILGLDCTATDREINRRAKEMMRLFEIDENPIYPKDIPLFIAQRDKKSVEKAEQTLLNSEKKLAATFFWFSVKDATDIKVMDKMASEEYKDAIELLDAKILSHPNDYLAIKNRAIINSLIATNKTNNKRHLKNSINDWSTVIGSEKQWKDFWKLFKLNNPNVDESLLSSFRKKVVPMLSDFYAELYIEDEDYLGYGNFTDHFNDHGPYLKEKVLLPLLDEINDASKKLAKIEQTPVTYVGENPVIVSSVYKIILKNVDKIDAATDMIYSLGGGIWDNGKVATVRNDSVAALRKVLFKISLSVEQPSIEDGGLMDKIVVLEKQLAASSYENERADKDAIIIKQNKNIALLDRAVKKRQNRMIIFYAGKVLETEDRPEERAKMQRAIVNASVLISRGIGNNYFVDEKPFSSNPKPAVKIHRIKTSDDFRDDEFENSSDMGKPVAQISDGEVSGVVVFFLIILSFVLGYFFLVAFAG